MYINKTYIIFIVLTFVAYWKSGGLLGFSKFIEITALYFNVSLLTVFLPEGSSLSLFAWWPKYLFVTYLSKWLRSFHSQMPPAGCVLCPVPGGLCRATVPGKTVSGDRPRQTVYRFPFSDSLYTFCQAWPGRPEWAPAFFWNEPTRSGLCPGCLYQAFSQHIGD